MSAVFPKPGPPGPAGSSFIYDVSTPSSSVTISHNLGQELVDVTAYDSGGHRVEVGVQVLDSNTVQITTESGLPFSGKVLVS